MTWTCPDCGREARIRKKVGTIRCTCGYRGLIDETPPRTPSRRNACITACRQCKQWMDFRCKLIAAGCRPSFLAALEAGKCPENKWPVDSLGRPCWVWPSVHKLNLLYHACPLRTNDVWRANVRQVKRRIGIFNGRKIVAVVLGDQLHALDVVRREFDDESIEYLTADNDPTLREVATFATLLASVESTDPEEASFYAHTKGNSTADNALGAEYWRNAMYHHLLDGVNACRDLLASHPCVGTHKLWWQKQRSPYPSGLQHGEWMFGGTFFWFRHDAIYGHPRWRDVPQDRYGAEAWLSGLFPCQQAATVFQPWPANEYPTPSPYDPTLYGRPIRDDI